METSTPIVTPLVDLLHSRKAMTTLISVVISLLVPFAPGLEEHRAELLEVGLILSGLLASVLVASIAHEDAAEKGAATTVNTGSGDVSVTPTPKPPTTPEGG